MKFFIFLVLFTSLSSLAFEKGRGSEFNLTSNGQKAKLSIYVAESKFSQVDIEMFMSAGAGIFSTNMWQQFSIGIKDTNSAVNIKNALIKVSGENSIMVMPDEFFTKSDHVDLRDFLVSNPKNLEKYKVGEEVIEVPAGKVKSTHYKKVSNDHQVDYWLSNQAGDIKLVKMISKGKKTSQNYIIELVSLLKNVKKHIDPNKSITKEKSLQKLKSLGLVK